MKGRSHTASRSAWFAILAAVTACGSERQIQQDLEHLYGLRDPQFQRTMGVFCGPGLLDGNEVQSLQNGVEIFPSMLEAIHGAQQTIVFATYIYWSEEIGEEFARAFAERSRAGVKVHVLVDWLGSNKMDEDHIALMEDAGVEFRRFHPLHWWTIHRLNNRLHSKILVVDGRVGFTGGVGIAQQWTGNAQDPDHWRESHFRVEGPVVAQMQAVFMDGWLKTTGVVLHGPEYFPELEPVGKARAQVFSSSPSGGSESMEMMYLLAITAAERSIHLSSAYFIPDDRTHSALLKALARGVQVDIITPGEHMDVETVRSASRARWGDLLAAGARIREYQPTMFHCKVLVVDGFFASVGSTNFDPRSFRLNDESNLNVYDEAFAREQIEVFERDAELSDPVTFEEWEDRPFSEKFGDWFASLFEPLL